MPHTTSDAQAALRLLTPVERKQLEAFAFWRVRGLGRKAAGRTGHDLLMDAIIDTLEGTRVWSEKVTFYVHLLGAMRSISTKWLKKKQPGLVLESELSPTEPEH